MPAFRVALRIGAASIFCAVCLLLSCSAPPATAGEAGDGSPDGAAAKAPEVPGTDGLRLRVQESSGGLRAEFYLGADRVLAQPDEGLWSIALGWRDGWPCDWAHAAPREVQRSGDWTILLGRMDLPEGTWQLRDAYRPRGRLLECVRRFTWEGKKALSPVTLSVRFPAREFRDAQAILPGILYNGNPSGSRSGRVPVYGGAAGEMSLFEEHRFPLPFVSVEAPVAGGRRGVALHSMPSAVPFGHLPDQWWSLGLVGLPDGQELTLLSGPCASNGRRSVIKAVQPGFVPYGDAWLEVPPGAVIEKTFLLEAFPVEAEGSGFSVPLRSSMDIFRPYDGSRFPRTWDIVRAKYLFAKGRWYEKGDVAGFRKYPDRPFFVMGWCGQAAALGYALQVLADDLGDPAARSMATRSLDFLSRSEFYESGFRTWYNYETGQWSGHEILSQGQDMLSFAHAIRVGRARGVDTRTWERFLEKACEVHAERILAESWRPPSTSEAFLIAPLCEGSRLLDHVRFREAAIKAGEHYAQRHVSLREPYWGGTLDASCEDKEGAYAAFQGFLFLHELTADPRFLTWARHACDVVLSYLVVWDIDMPPGRLRDHGFRSTGWTVVSPQNQHIDVYGVIMTPEIYRLGCITGDERLRAVAEVMFRSCGQLLDPYGSQGEQPQHTNYAQGGNVDDIRALRGGYHETWTVFWITAHFLNAAAQLRELGAEFARATP